MFILWDIWNLFVRLFRMSRIKGRIEGDPAEGDPGEYVCYYGCPNSKKADKLQLNRKAVR